MPEQTKPIGQQRTIQQSEVPKTKTRKVTFKPGIDPRLAAHDEINSTIMKCRTANLSGEGVDYLFKARDKFRADYISKIESQDSQIR